MHASEPIKFLNLAIYAQGPFTVSKRMMQTLSILCNVCPRNTVSSLYSFYHPDSSIFPMFSLSVNFDNQFTS
ncbi:uncharacterized protein [Bemisia tabaci]|uniref:uncharacterized protein isoform X2 n=1 Tax=Bemisia tabaci TaxID=7038 RepID=UPI003B28CD61